MGEVDRQAGVPFQFLKVSHLGTIVERQAAFQVFWQRGEQLLGADTERFLGSLRNVADESVPALPLDQRHQVASIVLAPHRVALPVAVEQAVVHCLGPGVDPTLLGW